MKNKFLQVKDKEDFNFLLLLIFVISLPFNYAYTNISMILWVCSAVTNSIIEKKIFLTKQRIRLFGVTSMLFFLSFFSLIYTSNMDRGLSVVIDSIPMLFFPVGFFLLVKKLPEKSFVQLLKTFVVLNVLLCLATWIYIYQTNIYKSIGYGVAGNHPIRDAFHHMTIHPTYFSVYILFSALIIMWLYIKKYISQKKIAISFYVLCLIVLVSSASMMSSRMPLVAVFFTLFFLILYMIRNKIVKYTILSMSILILTSTIYFTPYLKYRFEEIIDTPLSPPIGTFHNSTNIRYGILICSLSVLEKNWVLGVGIGDVQDKLDGCYNRFQTRVYQESTYNSHNQYLFFFLAAGLLGIFIFLTSLIYPFMLAFKTEHILYLSFLIFIMICFLTENILARQKGIMFYSLFNSLFAFQLLDTRKQTRISNLVKIH